MISESREVVCWGVNWSRCSYILCIFAKWCRTSLSLYFVFQNSYWYLQWYWYCFILSLPVPWCHYIAPMSDHLLPNLQFEEHAEAHHHPTQTNLYPFQHIDSHLGTQAMPLQITPPNRIASTRSLGPVSATSVRKVWPRHVYRWLI